MKSMTGLFKKSIQLNNTKNGHFTISKLVNRYLRYFQINFNDSKINHTIAGVILFVMYYKV